MQRALVVGTATGTIKHPSFEGWKLLVVQPLRVDGCSPDGDPLLVVDPTSATAGDVVLVTSDAPAGRRLLGDERSPVRWSVIAREDR